MKTILKIQGIIFLVLAIITLLVGGNILMLLSVPLTMIMAPLMLFSYPWGVETFVVALIVSFIPLGLMIYGYKKRNMKQGVVAFLLGFWLQFFASIMFLGAHF